MVKSLYSNDNITIENDRRTLKEWSQRYDLSTKTIRKRYLRGDRGLALIRPTKPLALKLTVNGHKHRIRELSKIYNVKESTISDRYIRGKRGTDLVKPVHYEAHSHVPERVLLKGRFYTFKELGRKYHLRPNIISRRYRRGDREDRLVRPKGSPIAHNHSRRYEIDGKDYTATELSKKYHINSKTIFTRYQAGKRNRELIRPVRFQPSILFHGEQWTFAQLANYYHLKVSTIKDRYYNGDRDEHLVRPFQSNSSNDSEEKE